MGRRAATTPRNAPRGGAAAGNHSAGQPRRAEGRRRAPPAPAARRGPPGPNAKPQRPPRKGAGGGPGGRPATAREGRGRAKQSAARRVAAQARRTPRGGRAPGGGRARPRAGRSKQRAARHAAHLSPQGGPEPQRALAAERFARGGHARQTRTSERERAPAANGAGAEGRTRTLCAPPGRTGWRRAPT